MIAARGNDHGFVFNRKPTHPNKVKAVRVKSERVDNKKRLTPAGDENSAAAQLVFPEPKRRLTEKPGNTNAATTNVVHEISVPLKKPPQPTPLISRTRTRLTDNGFVVGRRGTNVVDGTSAKPRSKHSRKSTMGGGRRRSTFSMRGKRASSIGGGFNAIPHESVGSADFYRHISPELPEPIRLRQLLAWCARRTDTPSSKWPSELPDSVQKLLQDALREAVDDIHSAFERGDIATSWYHRPIDGDQAAGNDNGSEQELQVHPENKANAELKEQLSTRIAKLQAEHDMWVHELKRASTSHARVVDRLPKPVKQLQSVGDDCNIEPLSKGLAAIDWSLLGAEHSYSDTTDADIKQAENQISRATEELQVQLDAFHLDMHRAHEMHLAAQSQTELCLKDLSFAFSQRRERAVAVASSSMNQRRREYPNNSLPDPTRDLLRTLSSVLSSS